MPLDNQDEDLEALAKIGIWGQRDQGILVDNVVRPISAADIAYLRERCPYIQILNIEATFENYTGVKFHIAKSGWTIQNLDDGACASAGGFIWGGTDSPLIENWDKKDPELLREFVNTGKGTVIKQAFDTSRELAEMVQHRWKAGIEIISGSDLMKWALWVACQDLKIKLIGFEPNEAHKKKRDRLVRLEAQRALQPKPRTQR